MSFDRRLLSGSADGLTIDELRGVIGDGVLRGVIGDGELRGVIVVDELVSGDFIAEELWWGGNGGSLWSSVVFCGFFLCFFL